jgi:branched-chain amino acid transport system substrate-binding protein
MRRPAIAVLAVARASAACSVSTPRREATGVRTAAADGLAQAESEAAQTGVAPLDETGAPLTVAGASPTDLGSGASGTGAGVDTTVGSSGATTATSPASGRTAGAPTATTGVPAAGGGNATGVTKDSITVSVIAGFSGLLSVMVNKAYDGLETWRDDVNANGGIHGRRVILKKVDHKETADGGVAACKDTQSNGSLMAIVPEGVDATLTAVSCLDKAGIPTIYYSGMTDPSWKVAFADIITSAQGGRVLAGYVARGLGGVGKKVGILYVNQLAYKATADTFVPLAKSLGVNVVAVEAVEPNQASFTSQLVRMKSAGVEILAISATLEAIGILRDAKSMGYKPTFTGWGYLFDFLSGGAESMFQGVTGIRTYAAVDAAAYAKYEARMRAQGRGRDRGQDFEGFAAYGHALVLGEVLQRAGTSPTRQSIVAGAETMKGYDNGILPPITWASGNHEGARAGFPALCCADDATWKSQGPPNVEFR